MPTSVYYFKRQQHNGPKANHSPKSHNPNAGVQHHNSHNSKPRQPSPNPNPQHYPHPPRSRSFQPSYADSAPLAEDTDPQPSPPSQHDNKAGGKRVSLEVEAAKRVKFSEPEPPQSSEAEPPGGPLAISNPLPDFFDELNVCFVGKIPFYPVHVLFFPWKSTNSHSLTQKQGKHDPKLRRSVIAFGGEVGEASLSTTHFVANDDLTAAQRQEHQKQAPGARWVDADWLLKCIAAQRVLPIRL